MFSLASGIYQSYFAPPKLSILIIGIDGSGKTSLLERVKVTNISNRLVINNNSYSDAPTSNLPPSYHGKNLAVAGLNNNVGDIPQTQKKQEGGKPARLPPPLPPKQAMQSRQCLEQMLDEGFSSLPSTPASPTCAEELVNNVPLPPLTHPLASGGNSESSETEQLLNNKYLPKKKATNNSTKPPLPPRHDSISDTSTKAPIDEPETPVKKKNSFMELLRCPSPKRYTDAVVDEDNDEYQDVDINKSDSGIVDESTNDNTWDTEYLQDYYINYQEGEDFDVKQPTSRSGQVKKMFPIERIRPTLGQNLAKLDLCGCKCSLFDLSGAEKMRPLWERYYRDTDAIIYVVNAAESSLENLHQSRREFEQMCNNDALQRRVRCGLPILIFANQLDVAYLEYADSMDKANGNSSSSERNGQSRQISWNADEEDGFVGGNATAEVAATSKEDDKEGDNDTVSKRVVDFHDLATLFGFPKSSISSTSEDGDLDDLIGQCATPVAHQGNMFLFGGSAKSGEGVKAAMELLISHAKSYHLGKEALK